jgi:Protein of unknown function (DUF2865)
VQLRGVEQALRHELPFQRRRRRRVLFAAIIAPFVLCAPGAGTAEGLFDVFFGGSEKRQASPQANFFSDPFGIKQQATPPPAPRSGTVSSGPAFCVRSCDGRYFPLMRGSVSAAQICQAFCPASPTRVFFGSSIESAYAANGERYAESENAFLYRKELRTNCTCNGRDPAGLAPVDLALDASLRPGDIVATTGGLVAYSGHHAGSNQGTEFTPIASYPGLSIELRARLNEIRVAPVRPDMIASDASLSTGSIPTAPLIIAPQPPSRDKRADAN